LNAGTDGPLPAAAVRASAEQLQSEAASGRTHQHFDRRKELSLSLRTAYASILGCPPEDIALTTCTSEGLALVIEGLRLAPGEEILTSDEEHPGLLGSLQAARDIRGVHVRMAKLSDLPQAVGPHTRLIACSHVSWMTGALAPAELAQVDVPVLLDGAQGAGAIPTDVAALGCDAYAGSGQKWLCGPDGTGMLFTTERLRERLAVSRRGYRNLSEPSAGIDSPLHTDARRLDTLSQSAETVACACAALDVLLEVGLAHLHARARSLAGELTDLLRETGREVTPGGASTLVCFHSPDPAGERERLTGQGVILRDIPGQQRLRASVGAWNDREDLERLLRWL
jgi:L-cysteine/cystine lyase